MGKTGKIKKKTHSVHSRAARRASSPSLNLDKSITTAKAPGSESTSTQRPSVLAIHRNAGVSKKRNSAASNRLSTKQRQRREKGIERAELNGAKLEKKLETSLGKGKAVKERSAAWEDLNGKLEARRARHEKSNGESIEKLDDKSGVAESISTEQVPEVILPAQRDNPAEVPLEDASVDDEIL
ncbi:MAG: hypothetical protein M4579_002484 [Chaenotheca gracillima]|nr:MAG: hypothetical protein M4579_002484 [Chaenotheca gracillima]